MALIRALTSSGGGKQVYEETISGNLTAPTHTVTCGFQPKNIVIIGKYRTYDYTCAYIYDNAPTTCYIGLSIPALRAVDFSSVQNYDGQILSITSTGFTLRNPYAGDLHDVTIVATA